MKIADIFFKSFPCRAQEILRGDDRLLLFPKKKQSRTAFRPQSPNYLAILNCLNILSKVHDEGLVWPRSLLMGHPRFPHDFVEEVVCKLENDVGIGEGVWVHSGDGD
jgi:hypothetical protein